MRVQPHPVQAAVDLAVGMIRQHEGEPVASAYHIAKAREAVESVAGARTADTLAHLLDDVRRTTRVVLHGTGRTKRDAMGRGSLARHNLATATRRFVAEATAPQAA